MEFKTKEKQLQVSHGNEIAKLQLELQQAKRSLEQALRENVNSEQKIDEAVEDLSIKATNVDLAEASTLSSVQLLVTQLETSSLSQAQPETGALMDKRQEAEAIQVICS